MKEFIKKIEAWVEVAKADDSAGITPNFAEIDGLIEDAQKLVTDEVSSGVRLSLPDTKEVNEAAESFGDLYSLDGQFANGCESGWKAGAEWMRDKVNEQIGNEA